MDPLLEKKGKREIRRKAYYSQFNFCQEIRSERHN